MRPIHTRAAALGMAAPVLIGCSDKPSPGPEATVDPKDEGDTSVYLVRMGIKAGQRWRGSRPLEGAYPEPIQQDDWCAPAVADRWVRGPPPAWDGVVPPAPDG